MALTMTPRRPVDVLWLVEHVDRELDVAVCGAIELERRFGLTVEIANYYRDVDRVTAGLQPSLVVVPFFYSADDPGTAVYVRTWPGAAFVDLRWEQVLYQANKALKRVRGEVARQRVPHVAWTVAHQHELREQGVPEAHALLTGNPAFALYQVPYRRAFPDRTHLAARHALDADRPWLFFPENYRWAFAKQKTLKQLEERQTGITADQLETLREYCQASLKTVVTWLNDVARESGWEVILRPRPSTDTDALQSLVAEVVGVPAPRLHVIKDCSVREWTLASDRVMSSFSTTLIEAALAGKPVNTITPAPVPELLRYDWCALVSDIGSAADLHDALHADSSGNPSRLQAWAREQFQPRGDAIAALAEALGRLAVNRGAASSGTAAASEGDERPRAPKWFFNTSAHDKDVWTPDELAARRARMLRAIGPDVQQPPSSNGRLPLSLSVVICTRNRQCQLARLLDSLARQAAHTLDVEVLVVDNGSTDETAAVCASRLTATSTVRYCHERRVGLSHARNRGLASSTRPYVLYLDDDAVLPPHYFARIERVLREQSPDFFGGPVYPLHTTAKPSWFDDRFETRKYAHAAGWTLRGGVSGGNLGVRRELLVRCGGFDPALGMAGSAMHFMEEQAVLEWYRVVTPRRRQRVFYDPDLFIEHDVTGKLTLANQLRRAHTLSCEGVLGKRRLGLASGLHRDSAWYPVERLGRVARATGRIAVRGVGALATSFPPRLTLPLASSLLELARASGELAGWARLRRTQAPTIPAEGLLILNVGRLTRVYCSAEDLDALMRVADTAGVKSGVIDFKGRSIAALEPKLRKERFRAYARLFVPGFLEPSLRRDLEVICGPMELVDLRQWPLPPHPVNTNDQSGSSRAIEWLQAASTSSRRHAFGARRPGIVVSGPIAGESPLSRTGRQRVLEWARRSGDSEIVHLRLDQSSLRRQLARARVAGAARLLVLGTLGADARRSLVDLLAGTEIHDLSDLSLPHTVYRAACAPDDEPLATRASLRDAVRRVFDTTGA